MIDPSSSEEEGDDDSIANVTSNKGRHHVQTSNKSGTGTGSIVGGSSISGLGSNIPTSGSNGDLTGNHRNQSNTITTVVSNRIDAGNKSVAGSGSGLGLGANKNQDQIQGSNRVDGGNLEVPNNGIPR